jgi:C1A family cysteine protease
MKFAIILLLVGVSALTEGSFLSDFLNGNKPTASAIKEHFNAIKSKAEIFAMTVADRIKHAKDNCPDTVASHALTDDEIQKNIDDNLKQVAETDGYLTGFTCRSALSKKQNLDTMRTVVPEGAKSRPATPPSLETRATVTPPASVDWRTAGYVTPVKNQGSCGSCWTFSAVGAMDGAVFKKTGKLPNFSEQNLVDCVTASSGCNGGWMTDAYDYNIKNAGQNNGTTYPYLAKQQTSCKYVAGAATNAGKVSSYNYTNQDDEVDIKAKLATVGPIAIAIDASATTLQNYVSGVYTCTNFTAVNHGVLLVGYGTDTTTTPAKDYYIVKNSWGTGWGEQGYIRIIRNKGMAPSCGLTTYANYVVA